VYNLRNRSLLKELDFTAKELEYLLRLAAALKTAKLAGNEVARLSGKNIALIFEKTSTRTRSSFEVAAYDQGAHVTYLDPSGSQIGHKESIADTARVLGRLYDAIEFRGAAQSAIEELGAHAGVPVYNGLTDEWHPTQMLAEPRELWPPADVQEVAQERARRSGARITLTDEPDQGLRGAEFVYTDVWVSLGEPKDVWRERVRLLSPYQVNRAAMEKTGSRGARFMHCLPAFHDKNTTVGREIIEDTGMEEGLEVTNDVFESPSSIVFEQAENRLHTIKAVLVATIGSG
jgi:ornithine carbamoyltransferase